MIKGDTWLHAMKFGEKLGCHQMADRSFFVGNKQFPLCARCTGVGLATPLAFIRYFFKALPVWQCLVLCSVMFLDWAVQRVGIKQSTNCRRFITGILGGYGYTMLMLHSLTFLIKKVCNLLRLKWR